MKKEKRKLNTESDDLKALDSELGSFGLEPPKIYRPEQREKIQLDRKEKINKARSKVAPKNKSKKQLSRAEQKKKREQKKKLRMVLSIAGLVLAVIIVFVILSLTVFFKIDTITIKGNNKYDTKQVIAVLPIEKEKNLFLCDTSSASTKLEKSLPYIYSVDIERKLPSTIIVTVHETPCVYSVKNADKTYTLLDDNFKVLEANVKSSPKKSIAINNLALKTANVGEKAVFSDKKLVSDLDIMTKAIKSLDLKEITAIYSTDINNNYLVYSGRITIKIGSTENIEDKIYSAYTAIDKLNESNPDASGELTSMGGKQVYFTELK